MTVEIIGYYKRDGDMSIIRKHTNGNRILYTMEINPYQSYARRIIISAPPDNMISVDELED